jgi:hypothetical protein
MSFKFIKEYPTYHSKDTPLAIKRRENHNAKIREKRALLEEHQKKGTLDKAILNKIYQSK